MAGVNMHMPAPADAPPPAHVVEGQNGGVQVDPAKAPPPADPQRPAWLPEGFNSPEELAAAYEKLAKPVEQPAAPPAPDAAREQVEKAGLDFAAISREYTEKGELSGETYAALSAKGISREVVDSYIAGQAALAGQIEARVAASVGGAESMARMLEWASANFSDEEAAAFNTMVEGANEATLTFVFQGLKSRMEAAVGREPRLLDTPTRAGGSAKAFASTAEIVAAMSDPRYESDSAYRATIEARLAVTDVFGV